MKISKVINVASFCPQYLSRMMGLNEEPGIIPRFCEDLFAQVAKKQASEVCSNSQSRPPRPVARSKDGVLVSRSRFFGVEGEGEGRRFPTQRHFSLGGSGRAHLIHAAVFWSVAQAALEFSVLVPPPPECWAPCVHHHAWLLCFSPFMLCLQEGGYLPIYVLPWSSKCTD